MSNSTFTDEEMKAIDKYLTYCVTNNKKCQTCRYSYISTLDNTKRICYFAAECYPNSQSFYHENKKLSAG